MNRLRFVLRQRASRYGTPALIAAGAFRLFVCPAFAELAVREVEIKPRAPESHVPKITAQGRFLAPQAVSAVDVSADGEIITADAIVPSHVTASVALNQNGSLAAILEYGAWSWVRTQPAIGKWNPPIHALHFLPRQAGLLRVFDGNGHEWLRERLPREGLYEVGVSAGTGVVWYWPAAWFARGMAGSVWQPVDQDARVLYRVALALKTRISSTVAGVTRTKRAAWFRSSASGCFPGVRTWFSQGTACGPMERSSSPGWSSKRSNLLGPKPPRNETMGVPAP